MLDTITSAHSIKLIANLLTQPQITRGNNLQNKTKTYSLKETTDSLIDYPLKKALDVLFDDSYDPQKSILDTALSHYVSGLTFQQAVNSFVKLVAKVTKPDVLDNLQNDNEIETWRLLRAGMISLVYSNVSEETLRKFQDRFMQFAQHDGLPIPEQDTFNYQFAYEEVLDLWDKSYDLFSGFSYFALATRRDGVSEYSFFEKFIQAINDSKNYNIFSPNDYGHDPIYFPGPGIVINGLQSKCFPDNYLNESFSVDANNDSPYEGVHENYRKLMIESEKSLKDTTFGLFRGAIIVRNPKMIIDNRRFALIAFNDHFFNEDQKMTYLIPDELANLFLLKPYERLHNFNNSFNEEHKHWDILNLTWPSVLGGMDKALPPGSKFYSDGTFYKAKGFFKKLFFKTEKPVINDLLSFESKYNDDIAYDLNKHGHRAYIFGDYWKDNYDPRNLIPFKKAHDEITSCTNIAFAQLSLLKEAFRLYSYGHSYKEEENNWIYNPSRLFLQAVRWHRSPRIQKNEKPILLPMPRLSYSKIDSDLIKETGFLDTKNLVGYKDSAKGNFMLPNTLNKKNIDKDTKKAWRAFLYNCYRNNADLVFLQGRNIRNQLTELLQ